MTKKTIPLSREPLSIDDVLHIARGEADLALDATAEFRARIDRGAEIVLEASSRARALILGT